MIKLLLVEDEVDLNRSLTKLLKKEHFSVDSAFDGEEALNGTQKIKMTIDANTGNILNERIK